MEERPEIIKGGLAVDDRGQLVFNNDFNFQEAGIKRFYMIQNHTNRFIRAWHGHKKEAKYITVLQGAAVIKTRSMDEDENDSTSTILTDRHPAMLYIPKGRYNGIMNLTEDTLIMVYSTTSLEESQGDDYRLSPFHWDINEWEVEYR